VAMGCGWCSIVRVVQAYASAIRSSPPPSLRRFATQGLLPVSVLWCWDADVASLLLVPCGLRVALGSLRILID